MTKHTQEITLLIGFSHNQTRPSTWNWQDRVRRWTGVHSNTAEVIGFGEVVTPFEPRPGDLVKDTDGRIWCKAAKGHPHWFMVYATEPGTSVIETQREQRQMDEHGPLTLLVRDGRAVNDDVL